MTFRFIHTADWQIGKPFQRFEGDVPALLKAERVAVINRIGEAARKSGAQHVLVAGDVWDSDAPTDKTLKQALEILKAQSSAVWWLLPGNHDPARSQGLWQRISEKIGVPDNVHLLLSPEPVEVERGVFVLPAPWTSKNPGRDITAWMASAETPPGALRIGLAHGSTRTFGGDAAQSAAIAADRAISAGLDYLALGDWHGRVEVDARTWYSGTPEPDSFQSKDPGWCLSVGLDDCGAPVRVESVRTAEFSWRKVTAEMLPGMPVRQLLEEAVAGTAPRHRTLVDLTVVGRAHVHERADLAALLSEARDEFAYVGADLDGLDTILAAEDLDLLAVSGPLRQVALRLQERAGKADGRDAGKRDAARALDLLFAFVAARGGVRP